MSNFENLQLNNELPSYQWIDENGKIHLFYFNQNKCVVYDILQDNNGQNTLHYKYTYFITINDIPSNAIQISQNIPTNIQPTLQINNDTLAVLQVLEGLKMSLNNEINKNTLLVSNLENLHSQNVLLQKEIQSLANTNANLVFQMDNKDKIIRKFTWENVNLKNQLIELRGINKNKNKNQNNQNNQNQVMN